MTVKNKESIKRRDKGIEQVSDGEVDVEEAIGKRWDGGKGEGGGGDGKVAEGVEALAGGGSWGSHTGT
jgi:hypothetical protein